MLVVAFVAASIALSDMMSSCTWLDGGHATPEQWAVHQFYESVGAHDHHGHADVAATDTTRPDVTVIGIGPTWSAAVPGSATNPGQGARDTGGVDLVVSSLLTPLMRVQPGDLRQPAGPDFLTLDPPPRLAA